MRMYDVIDKKKKGQELTEEEVRFAIDGYVAEEIPDYQMSALLMAIYYQGMTDKELYVMTDCMAKSGEMVDLSEITGIKVDKHSTGGVGDKTTLVVAPLVAACGGKVAKMSGRGLGFTGGTIDKLESIPGLETAISQKRFFEIVNDLGVCVIGQSAQIAPADKKLYALRDVTATVDSIPLIAASIMSKKLASGSDKIVLDVTVGSGAFMKEEKAAKELARRMVEIGENAGKETVAIITNMDVPLGIAVGNDIEVMEAIHTLQGQGPEDFEKICIEFAAYMLYLGEIGSLEECKKLAEETLHSGKALEKFAEMVRAQGGEADYIYHMEERYQKPLEKEFCAGQSGYIQHMDTELCGKIAAILGAGRETKESTIDPKAGILFHCKTGDYVTDGTKLATLYSSDEKKMQEALKKFPEIYQFGAEKTEPKEEILGYVTKKDLSRQDK
jgi:pyrimidine-nucleoside phosphorylase